MRKRYGKRLFAGLLCAAMVLGNVISTGLEVTATDAGEAKRNEADAGRTEDAAADEVTEKNENGSVGEAADGKEDKTAGAGSGVEGPDEDNGAEDLDEGVNVDGEENFDDKNDTDVINWEDDENAAEGNNEADAAETHSSNAEENNADAENNAENETEAIANESESESEDDAYVAELLGMDVEDRIAVMSAEDDIASGTYGDIAWVIDADGKLTVTGSGEFSDSTDCVRAPWYSSRESIKTAVISVSGMTNASYMFYDCSSLTSVDVSNFDTGNVKSMHGMFCDCSRLTSVDVSNFDTSNVKSMHAMFYGCSSLTSVDLSNFNTSNVMTMTAMFYRCNNLTSVDLNNFNTSNVTEMISMFSGCSSLTSLDVSNFDTSNVTNMSKMFFDCSSLISLDLSNFDTSNVTYMGNMFNDCSSLASVDLSNFDTSNVTDMGYMFGDCSSLASVDVSNFNTSNVTQMYRMFYGCSSLTSVDLSNFDTSNVKYMYEMFSGCSSLTSIDLSDFDTSSVTSIRDIFYECTSLTIIYTPYNLTCSAELPTSDGDAWYRSDGSIVTELPKNLSYSVVLVKKYRAEDEAANKLLDTGSSIFRFKDAKTGNYITKGKVCIEEEFSGTHYYSLSENNGSVAVPLSKGCKSLFISADIDGYESMGGWAELSYYRTQSGVYTFNLTPRENQYVPKLPSVKTSVSTSGPDVELEEEKISLFDMKMDFDMNFGKGVNAKVTYDDNSKTVKVALSTEGKVAYDEIKKKYSASGAKSGQTIYGEFDKAGDEMQPGTFGNISFKEKVEGYMEFTYDGDFIEGGVLLTMKVAGESSYRPACTAGLAYAKFELSMSAQGKLVMKYVDGNFDLSSSLKLEPGAKIAVGLGWKLAHTEAGVEGKFPIVFTFPYEDDYKSLKVDVNVEVYGEVVILCFGTKKSKTLEGNIWPSMSLKNSDVSNSVEPVIDEDALTMLPRDYLSSKSPDNTSLYSIEGTSALTDKESFRYSEISPDKGVFEENNVQYAKLSDGTEILAWVHDFGDKSDVNRTTLCYSVNKNDGKGWGAVTPVCGDTSCGDYYPDMIAKGDKAYLVWNKASEVFGDEADTDYLCKHMDVCVSVFENGRFSEPRRVSDADNALMEFSPRVAADGDNIAVAWMINSENNYYYTKGSNSIYVCEYRDGVWGSPVCVAKNLNYISDYALDYVDGRAAIVYAQDADNVSDTEDGTAYYVRDGVKSMVGDSSYNAETVGLSGGKLYFAGNGRLYKADCGALSAVSDTGIESRNFEVLKNAAGEEAVLFITENGFARDIYVSYYKNGAYTYPVPLISDGGRVTDYSAFYNDDGTFSLAYDEQEVLTDSTYIYGLTDMVIEKNVKPNAFFVASTLYYNAYDVVPQSTVEFNAAVYNYTDEAIQTAEVVLTGSSSGEVYRETRNVDIPVGGEKIISVSYTLPENIVNEYYTLTVTPQGAENMKISGTGAACEVGYSDIEISDVRIEENIIKGKISNVGYKNAENITLKIYEDSEENEPIAELAYSGNSLAIGGSWEFSQELSPAEFENVSDIKYYIASASTDSQENNYANNSAAVYKEPVAAESITLNEHTLSMTKNTSVRLEASVLPENAEFKEAEYTSDDNSVALVDNNGNIYAVGEGKAVITAYTLDGNYSDECEVTVEAAPEEKYILSSRAMDLVTGDTASLELTDKDGNIIENAVWSSTNENVAVIDSEGNIKAVGEGLVMLVVRIDDFVDACFVRVSGYFVRLESEEITLKVGESVTLNAETMPVGAAVTYTSDDTNIAEVSETGLITGKAEGTTYVHVTAGNYTADCKVTVEPESGGGTGGEEGGGASEDDPDSATVLPEDIPEGGIPSGLWISAIPGQTYTGSAIRPSVRVYDNDRRLKNGTDYTLTYKNNTKANDASNEKTAPSVIVKGKGNYSGTETAVFEILPVDLSDTSVISYDLTLAYNKKVQKKVPEVTYNGKKLKNNKDFTVSYPDLEADAGAYKEAGEYEVLLTAKAGGNFTGTRTVTLTITNKTLISKAGVKKIADQPYTGEAIEPAVSVSMKKTALTEGTDYTVTYENNEEVGTAAALITGIGEYAGTKRVSFKITGTPVKKAQISGLQDRTYDGTPQTQSVLVSLDAVTLEEGRDYEISYSNNINAGKASVIITGKGGYTGTLKKTFKIFNCLLTEDMWPEAELTVPYVKGGAKPVPVLTYNGMTLKEGRDYTLSYKNNKAVTGSGAKQPSVIIKGKGNFKGSFTKYFTITAKSLDDANSPVSISVADKAFVNKAGKYMSKPVLTDADGKKLAAGKDYEKAVVYKTQDGTELTKNDTPAPGSVILVTVTGKGAYSGILEGAYRITEKDFSKARITIKPQSYTGSAVTIDENDITVRIGGETLRCGTDYEIVQDSYANNVKKGTATVTIVGKESYGGMKKAKFKITARRFSWFWRLLP